MALKPILDTQAIELDWLKGNKFHEGIGQALHYGDVTGQQPVLALISAYYNIFGAEQQKLEYVSGLCAAHGVEVSRRPQAGTGKQFEVYDKFNPIYRKNLPVA